MRPRALTKRERPQFATIIVDAGAENRIGREDLVKLLQLIEVGVELLAGLFVAEVLQDRLDRLVSTLVLLWLKTGRS